MPKGFQAQARTRGPYATQACTICRAKKSKCDGVKPVCGSCTASGRADECSWGRDTATRKPRTEAHFEALRKRSDSLQAYVDLLESILAKCVCQDVSSHLQFRPQQLGELSGPEGGLDSDLDVLDSDEEITKELTVPTHRLKLDDRSGSLLHHGMTAPNTINFGNKPYIAASQIPVVDNPNATYVLQVDNVDISQTHPNIDWSRYLPPEVALDRREHDKILDLSFKFFTMWTFRVVPALFLRDMYRALSVHPSEEPPRTAHYSPMLHNAVLSVSSVYSDDPYIRDPKTRLYFTHAARKRLFDEIQKPNFSIVHSLAFIGTFYGDIGDRVQAELYFGMSSRLSMTLGLGVDATPWVKAGLIQEDESIGRVWAYWTLFSLDVCWALYFGRDFGGPPQRNTPMPFVDSEMDQMPWYYPPANIPPQPNYLTLVFSETAALLTIARQITDVVNGLHSARSDAIKVHENITKIDLELNNWKSRLPPQLDITLANKAKSTPQRLMLHLAYWWCSITLHRPFFNRRTQPIHHSDPEIDHVKLCTRAAENILELVETWSSLYTLRCGSVTMLQVIFSAGTIFLLRALQATANPRIAHGILRTALTQAETCVRYLHAMGHTWAAAMRTGDLLHTILNDRLRPVLRRRLAHTGEQIPVTGTSHSVPPSDLGVADPHDASLFPRESAPLEGYPIGWNPQADPTMAGWSQSGNLNFLSQIQSTPVAFGVESTYPAPALMGDAVFPDLDMNRFLLSNFGYFGGPELGEEDLSDSAGALSNLFNQ